MKKYYSFLFWIQIFLFSCSQYDQEVKSNENLIVVDIDKEDSLQNVPYSSIFSDIKIVNLELNEECIIGRIDFIEFLGDTLLIKDGRFKTLYLFSPDGKFLCNIGSIGKGPGQFLRLDYITYDTSNKEIYVFDQSLQKIIVFTSDGSFSREIFLKKNIRVTGIAVNDGQIYINELPFPSRNRYDHYLIRIIDNNGIIKDSWFKNRGIPITLTSNIKGTLYENKSGIIFNQEFLDTIFRIKSHEITPYIYIKSSNELSNSPYNINSNKGFAARGIEIKEEIGVHSITNYLENIKLIYFECMNGRKGYDIIIRKDENKIIATSLDDDLTFSFDNWRVLGMNKKYMVREIKGNHLLPDITQDLSGLYQDAINNKINISEEDIKKIKETLNVDHNPVLIFYKFKSTLYE